MKRSNFEPWCLALALLLIVLWMSAPLMAQQPDLVFELTPAVSPEASPPLPDLADFPVQLVLDDDGAEGSFGVGAPEALQFMWLNQFERSAFGPISLQEIWVLFPDETNVIAGAAIEIAIYNDSDSDPTTGAELVMSFDDTIQVADGDTFSIYELPAPLTLGGSGDVLVGVVNRFVDSGVTSETRPAAIDITASQGRSWIAVWSTDPPPDLALPADLVFETTDGTIPGNWMIRAFGTEAPVVVVPTLNAPSLMIMFLGLALAGLAVFRRLAQPTAQDRN